MSNKVFNTRIQNKHGTEADWAQAINFTPLLGELIVYDIDENHSVQRIKIGDGVSNVNALPFVNTPDWNAKEGEEGHVKNRTHWVEYNKDHLPLPTGEWTFSTDEWDETVYISQFASQEYLNLIPGEEYIINVNGTEYSTVAEEDPYFKMIVASVETDDISISITETLPDSTFFGNVPPLALGLITYKDISENLQVNIYKDASIYYPLNEKFLPKNLLKEDHSTSDKAHEDLFNKKPGLVHEDADGLMGETFNDHETNRAYGYFSHAEGKNTCATSDMTHTEGFFTIAAEDYSHAEGGYTVAFGTAAHAEGFGEGFDQTYIHEIDRDNAIYSFEDDYIIDTLKGNEIIIYISESYNIIPYTGSAKVKEIDIINRTVTLDWSLPYGANDKLVYIIKTGALATAAHSEGFNTAARSAHSHAEGTHTIAAGRAQHVQGEYNIIDSEYDPNNSEERGKYAHILGNGSYHDDRSNAHTIDWDGNAWFSGDVYVGSTSGTNKDEGSEKLIKTSELNKKPGKIVTGEQFTYSGQTYTAGEGAENFNDLSTNKAVGDFSHAEGCNTIAMGHVSHVENYNTAAHGFGAHAEGYVTSAIGDYSHAEGMFTRANGEAQHVQGKYNIYDHDNDYAHIIGNGGNEEGNIYYSNAHTVDWDGNAWFAGNIKIGGTGQDDENAKTLATTNYVDAAIESASIIVQDNEPSNVPDGTLWLDTDAQGAVSGGFTMEEIINSVIAALPNAEEASF